ncbi:Aste57867_21149 [Aphanomyces stellatus]|uniref:Aste57867_21149 protein n=1 Tax=Aphanomyces stellatus TaxID=120398 RepID=A0A485LHC9_9STRA|nr:hypothetical protein As57867_021081 [Aphanomyces stellatus]VFT97823.1 Aste57867_21149 [Aphanomyces stellatus]
MSDLSPTSSSLQVLLEPNLMPFISDFQTGTCPGMQVFAKWTVPLLRAHPSSPPGKTYFEIVESGLDAWYAAHGVKTLAKLIASLPKMETIALVSAVFSGRVDVLFWFQSTGRLATIDLPLLSIAAWNGQLDVVRTLDEMEYPGCAVHALQWATAKGHTRVREYLQSHPRSRPCPCAATAFVEQH